jgi:tetratricopeptide (TPR) repeat protein
LYQQAFEKYKEAIAIKPDNHESFHNWGTFLGYLAKTKEGKEAEELYQQAFDKFERSVEFGGRTYNLSCLHAMRGRKIVSYSECVRDWLNDHTATCPWQGANTSTIGKHYLLCSLSLIGGFYCSLTIEC